MKAMVNARYGSPDVMELMDVAKPTPNENEVLVKVYASSVNAADWHMLRGAPYFFRLIEMGFPKPKITILGGDVAGIVEAVGSKVTQFEPGDAVFGDTSLGAGFGAFAEYVAVTENLLVPKPANVSFEQAAAVPLAGATALQGLRKAGDIRPGDTVLINGATGGVGQFAVQIAKAYGAEVTGMCHPNKMDTVRAMGADHALDYTKDEFPPQAYDVIIDIAASRTAADYSRALKPQGRYVFVGFSSVGHMIGVNLKGAWISRRTDKRFIFMGTAQPNQADLRTLGDLLAAGHITPYIDQAFPLSGVPDAIRLVESRAIHGKVVISVAQDEFS